MVFTQAVPQRVRPVLQVQVPLTQPSVDGVPPHWLPHAPQFCRLVWVLMQKPEQLVRPTWQVQAPATQTWLNWHWLPQAPQLLLFDWVLVQTPLHIMLPEVQ